MNLTTLPKITTKTKRRVGQGHGSGRVKTAGRGTKGQKARGHIKLSFEGGALPLIKRLPFQRGKGKNKPIRKKFFVVNIGALNVIPAHTVVDADTLAKYRIIGKEAKEYAIKILGDGELSVALQVKLPVSKGAKAKIEKAGGTVGL